MALRRFFVDFEFASLDAPIALPERVAFYAHTVLRLSDGAEIELFNGRGAIAICILEGASARVREMRHVAQPHTHIRVASALIKGPRQDWLIEKLAEMGVSHYLPLLCERSTLPELPPHKRERMQRLAQAAARQSGQGRLMQILEMQTLPELCLQHLGHPEHVLIAMKPQAPQLLSTVLTELGGPLHHCTLLLGPEGDLSEGEMELIARSGGHSAALGGPILRTETAAMSAAALLLHFVRSQGASS